MNLLQQYLKFIKEENLFNTKDKLLLAVSGGVDSVVLCELCHQAGFNFEIAHCNFQLRGEESERDEKFVRQLAAKYHVPVHVKRFETGKFATENKMSVQEAARKLRYTWFDELIENVLSAFQNKEHKLQAHLLTAHHADDNAETVLMNFCRGTGLHGLTGIPASHGNVKRPLLVFSKEELLQFARKNNLEFMEDSSNSSSKYTRNLFRNEIIPAISKVFPEVKTNLADNINRFSEIEKLYNVAVAGIKKKLIKPKGHEWHIPVKQLMQYENRALIYEIITDFGFGEKQVDEVIKLADSESGKYIDSPSHKYRIIRHRHWFIISPVNNVESAIFIIDEKDKSVSFEQGVLKIEKIGAAGYTPDASNSMACLDAKELSFPLLLRKYKAGDYFYPLGMRKKKKLSRFLIDQKLSKTQKEKTWVIEMNKKIIWVVGSRIDDRFKISPATKEILKISLISDQTE